MTLKTSATLTLWCKTKLLKSDASAGLITLPKTIESIRSSNSEQIDSLSGLQNKNRNNCLINESSMSCMLLRTYINTSLLNSN